jgi:hypothetical protein
MAASTFQVSRSRHRRGSRLLLGVAVISQMLLITGVPVWMSSTPKEVAERLTPCRSGRCGCSSAVQSAHASCCCCQSRHRYNLVSEVPSTPGIRESQAQTSTWLMVQQVRQCRGFQDDGGFPLIFSPSLIEPIARVMPEPVCVGWLILGNEPLVQRIQRPDAPPPRI